MPWIATAAALLSTGTALDAPEPAVPQRQARAVVTIVRAARIRLGPEGEAEDQEALRTVATIREPDGSTRPAVLVEFY